MIGILLGISTFTILKWTFLMLFASPRSGGFWRSETSAQQKMHCIRQSQGAFAGE
jgi:hypothetical protein